MNNPRDDELLSAYLDGELSGSERAEVEAWLAEDPSARQTLDEFRAVQGAIRDLPAVELGEDLSARVLQLAERRLLTEGPATTDSPTPRSSQWASPVQRFLSRRALVWTGLALAIALAIMVTDRQRPVNRAIPHPGAEVQANREPIPQIRPQAEPTLRPMPGQIAKNVPPNPDRGGIRAADPGAARAVQQQVVWLVKCFVREDKPNVLNTLLARQRIVRDETPRLIEKARQQLGDRIRLSPPPPGWVAAGEPALIYAEANSSQIEGLLQALASQREDFPQVVAEPGQKGASDQRQSLLLLVQPVRRQE